MSKRLADCQRVIGYHFANPALLEIALTHSSVRTPDKECNERQEFLGDSVLGLAITEELYKRLPDQQEGELTRIKSAVVSRGALYRVSMRMGLPRFVEVAKGVGRREELPVSLTANLVESIIGAIYLDAGFFPAREFILRNLGPEVEDVMNDRVPKNYKSLLQHEAQQILGATPVYRTIEEEGPDHRKAFTVAAVIRGTEYGRASGINKKEAEQESARHALEAITRRGRGRRRRPEGRGEGGRGDRGEPARGDDRDLRPRDREAVRGLARQTSDDDAWRAWAEGSGDRPPGAPAREPGESVESAEGAHPPAAPAPYVVGPEPEEAYLEGTDVAERASHPPPRDAGSTGSGGVEADAPDSPPGEGEPTRGRRRRGRRGGRRRRGDDGPADGAAPAAGEDVGTPAASTEPDASRDAGPSRGSAPADVGPPGLSPFIAPEADASDDLPAAAPPEAARPPRDRAPRGRGSRERLDRYAVDAPPPARGGRGGGRRGARSGPETPAVEPESAVPPVEARPPEAAAVEPPPARAPRERAPRERAPRERAPAPEAPPPAPAPSSAFGQGVVGEGLPPPPAPIDREVTPVGGVKAVKKAPVVPREKPPAGGFGVGL